MNTQNKTAIIIGCGIAGPVMAMALQRIGVTATIYEGQQQPNDDKGVFLGISPNGLNVLKEFMPLENLLTDYTPASMTFYNAKNKCIGSIDNSRQQKMYGAATIQLKRGQLNKQVREAAIKKGIHIQFGKKLTNLTQHNNMVTAFFEDGTNITTDFLIGCDGIHSATRKSIFPGAPRLCYTGLLSTGGFSVPGDMEGLAGSIRMIFGEKAFFAYAVSNKNEVWWFNNIASAKEPQRNELNNIEQQALKERLLEAHENDPALVSDIIRSANHIEVYPIYDIPFLQQWYKGNVCLIGDAAHATAPHIGQGASLALEDTLVLAKCIRDLPEITTAFTMFQQLRQHRVQKIIRQARKVGNSKTTPNKLQQFFRDLLLPVFVKMEAKKMDWVYRYKIDLAEKISIRTEL